MSEVKKYHLYGDDANPLDDADASEAIDGNWVDADDAERMATEIESLKRELFLESQGKKFITICHHCEKTATKVVCVCDEHSLQYSTNKCN